MPFLGALKPPSHLDKYVEVLNFTTLPANEFRIVEISEATKIETGTGTTHKVSDGVLVMRSQSGEYFVYWFPTWFGVYPMPGVGWGQQEGYCERFSLDSSSATALLRCAETTWDEYFQDLWVWDIDGKHISGELPNLIKVPYQVRGQMLYVSLP